MRLLLVISLFLMVGCAQNSAFYYPSDRNFRGDIAYLHLYQDLWLASASGNRIHGQLHRTESQPPRGLIVQFHGNRGNLTASINKLEWLLSEGYDLLVFDYSGFGRSEGRPYPENTRLDSLAVIQHVLSLRQPHDKYRRILWGTSLGGAVLVDAFAVLPEHQQRQFDLVVVDSAFDSYQKQAGFIVSRGLFGRVLNAVVPWVVSDQFAPVRTAHQIEHPDVLFVHCEDDRVVSLQAGKRLYEAISAQKYFWQRTGCRHARPFGPQFLESRARLLQALSVEDTAHWLEIIREGSGG